MVSISTTVSNARFGTVNFADKGRSSVPPGAGKAGYSSTYSNSTVSSLARQLSDAATRAALRDSTSSFNALGRKAAGISDQWVGETFQFNKAKNDAEVPASDDPELMARARQATGFLNGTDSNPFKGMSRDQLALITYDEGGEFTINERRAAWQEAGDQEQVWRRQVVQKAMDEYDSTGKMTKFFSEVLEHYLALPAIERAQYPENYAADLQQKIDLDLDYRSKQMEGKSASLSSIVEALFGTGVLVGEGASRHV